MKKRLGFVSNSSASSFLLGIAVIEDDEKFNKWWNDLRKTWSDYDVSITTVYDLTRENCPYGVQVKDGKTEVECFRGDTVSLSLEDRQPTDRVLIVNIANDEGDGGFPREDPYDEFSGPDYDIDLDFLGADQVRLYNGILDGKESGLVDGHVKFGAARNG